MKLNAFTLLEVMVGIIISGFVMGIGYSVFVYGHKYYSKSTTIKQEMVNYFEFSGAFIRDAENAVKIVQASSDEVEFITPEHSTTYAFHSDIILRTKNQHIDTFHLKMDNIHLELLQGTELVNYIHLTNEMEELSYYKSYGAVAFIPNF